MRVKPKTKALFCLCTIFGWLAWVPAVTAASAADTAAKAAELSEGGLGGEIILGGAVMGGRPGQLDVGEDNKTVSRLDADPERESTASPFVSGELYYTLASTGTTFFLSAESEGTGLSAGVSQYLGNAGQISVAGLFGEEEVWKDPYLTGVKRRTTKAMTYGVNLAYEEIFGTGAFVSVTNLLVDVDDDEIGDRIKRLRRDGVIHRFESGYRFALSDSLELTPALRAESRDMRGEANSSDGGGGGLAVTWTRGPWSVETGIGVGYSEYRKEHPVFDKTRKAKRFDAAALIGYTLPLRASAVTLYAMGCYQRVDENISFFHKEGWVAGMGVGVEF